MLFGIVGVLYNLYKIHGCISDEKSLVFTKNKYIQTYANENFNEFIKQIFSQYTVLFVGYGLSEFELLDRIYKAIGNPYNKGRHFYLKEYFKHEKELCSFESEYFANIGIDLVPFARDKNDYRQLINVIDNWNTKRALETQSLSRSFDDIDKALGAPDE